MKSVHAALGVLGICALTIGSFTANAARAEDCPNFAGSYDVSDSQARIVVAQQGCEKLTITRTDQDVDPEEIVLDGRPHLYAEQPQDSDVKIYVRYAFSGKSLTGMFYGDIPHGPFASNGSKVIYSLDQKGSLKITTVLAGEPGQFSVTEISTARIR